jgi:RNA polymerase sigma factor (sigma-70 family)
MSRMQDTPGLVDHLFRQEAGKMISYLTRIFGLNHLDMAEDVVQDTLCRALELWPIHGIPHNPSAWLMRVARNRAIDLVRRDTQLQHVASELLHRSSLGEDRFEESAAFSRAIQDDQLRMMFICCHHDLSIDAQVTLILKTLCGFSVSEIAQALLSSEDAIEKRLGRARKIFRKISSFVEITETDTMPVQLEAVYRAIYLLFNEGYHGSQAEQTIHADLCFEAIRLAVLLSEHSTAALPKTYALIALLCFHAARLPGRIDDHSGLIQLETQDRTTWDQDLLLRGFEYLERSALGNEMSEYHLEAGIAALHCAASTYANTDWVKILELYTLLYRIKPSPIVALNRAIAVGNACGPAAGLAELRQIPDQARLMNYPFYPAAQGEFCLLAGQPIEAITHFASALTFARNRAEIEFFERKYQLCRSLVNITLTSH